MEPFDVLIAALLGIVEGITEWLPISSTGHMILINQFLAFSDADFQEMFLVVVQLGAILAVVLLFWKKIWPFNFKYKRNGKPFVNMEIMQLWFKILVSCLPAAIVGVLFDSIIEEMFYNAIVVAGALIIYGILFIVIENWNKGRRPVITNVAEIGYNTAIIIGIFQLLAAIVPGTSRSGATIIGALLIGVARGAAAEYTFYLAIPVMFGASLLKIVKNGLNFGAMGYVALITGMLVAFIVSLFVIKFLMSYIRKHDFKVFGYYRIALGVVVLLYFFISGAAVV
ncbi:MAG: undecaprenyl-diphosphate phosphatase [Lachnospiraceae bacterium]|nr:undecaprenyl-diphosphate phosphatase [Lachnospiraceae bacterium]